MKNSLINLLLVTLLIFLAGCSSTGEIVHEYMMRGQILDISDGDIYLCIGSNDGAQVGQELVVVRFIKNLHTRRGLTSFKREIVGSVKIIEIIDEHYAKAKILTGNIGISNLVELTRN